VKYKDQPSSKPDCWSANVDPEHQDKLDSAGLIKTATKDIKENFWRAVGEAILHRSLLKGYSILLNSKLDLEDVYPSIGPSAQGLIPIPIYTACFEETSGIYQWQEFTPWEIGGTFLTTFFAYDYLVVEKFHTPPHLSDLTAVWGSAYNAEFVDILSSLGWDVPERIKAALGHAKLPASGMNNPNYGQAGLPLFNQKKVYLRDAGVTANIPVLPLLPSVRSERTVDLLIVLDASATVREDPFKELQKSLPDLVLPTPPYTFPYVFEKTDSYPEIIYSGDEK